MRTRSLVFVGVLVMSACNPEPQTCDQGLTLCDSQCLELTTSPLACGACGVTCDDNQRCMNGACVTGCQLALEFDEPGAVYGCYVCDPSRSTTALSPREDGSLCEYGICHDAHCEVRCFIDGGVIDTATINPENPCEQCTPGTSTSSWSSTTDGVSCGNTKVCHDGACVDGCFIDGSSWSPGALNQTNPCEQCSPQVSKLAWTPVANGLSCGGTGMACANGTCAVACNIVGNTTYASGTLNPANACQRCDPNTSTTTWTPVELGTSCGGGMICENEHCLDACFIDGGVTLNGVTNWPNTCEFCDTSLSTTSWQLHPDGYTCGTASFCFSNQCLFGCRINNATYTRGTVNPANPCEFCSPFTDSASWTAVDAGTVCGNGQVCNGNTCGAGCFVDNMTWTTGAVNPMNACEVCAPGISTTAWSMRASGEACGSGLICGSGTCAAQCFINGTLIADNALDPANSCERCIAAQSTTTWSSIADGTSCGAGHVCSTGACNTGCFIAQAFIDAGVSNSINACETCDPASSTTSWSALDDGASCGSGVICENHACVSKCVIEGGFIDAGAIDPSTLCRACLPATSTSEYSLRGIAPLLTPGTDITAQGWSVARLTPWSLTDDGGVIVLSTGTTGSTGGQQLLYRRISATGGPFTLRVDWRVDAVNPHNTLDSAAAIFGRYVSFVDSTDRAQMVYLDAVNVGWADDTQSAAVGNIDGGFHLYELSVDADAGARFSVDGVQRLSRANFATNGVIAIGDQTNDSNVDSTITVRSVTLVCQ
jgi:hypothetical protein